MAQGYRYSETEGSEGAALVHFDDDGGREDTDDDAVDVVRVSSTCINRRLVFGLLVIGACLGFLLKSVYEREPVATIIEGVMQPDGSFHQESPAPTSQPKLHNGNHKEKKKKKKKSKVTSATDGASDEIASETVGFPAISDLLNGTSIIGDISWLLDFAIVGNSKCGTSFLMRYIGQSNDTFIPQHEICKMSKDRPDEIVRMFYNESTVYGRVPGATADGQKIKNGLKCPKESSTQLALANYAKYFPKTKFIVTTRHPVLWFQSFYNYRSHGNGKLPSPHELIGACMDGSPYVCSKKCAYATHTQNVCTDRGKFHHYLSRFGKTPMSSPHEKRLLNHEMDIIPIKGEIFLMELDQVFPTNAASKHLARDLKEFLGLQHELPKLEDLPPESAKYTIEEQKYFINICDKEHEEVRKVLLDIGRNASIWIRDFFLKSPDVVVSSRSLFLDLIEKWGHDPCL